MKKILYLLILLPLFSMAQKTNDTIPCTGCSVAMSAFVKNPTDTTLYNRWFQIAFGGGKSMRVPAWSQMVRYVATHAGISYTASRGVKLVSNDFRLDTTVIDTLHGLFTRNAISINGANMFSIPDFQGSRFLVVGNITPVVSAARISQAETITLNSNGDHSFGAYSDFTAIGTPNGSAVASYDSKNRMFGAVDVNHFIDFQARNVFQAAANLDHMYAFDASDVHAGSGVLNNVVGFHGTDPTVIGGGAITNSYGMYIENLVNGVNNHAIYTNLGINRLGDKTGILIEPLGNFDIGTNTTKTGSATISYLGRTNEMPNYEALLLGYVGDATAANRVYQFQSIEQGVSNSGNIAFQPAGGKLFYGDWTVSGNEVAKKSDVATKQTQLTLTTTGTSGAATLVGATLNIPQYSGGSSALTPTAVKTANYTASVNDFVPVDNTSGNINITLPTAPTDKSQIGVKLITLNSAYTATLVTGGSDVFNKAGGGTTLSLKISSQGATVQYNSALGVWYVMNDDMPLAQLDARYTQTQYGNIYVKNSWTSGTLASDFPGTTGVTVSSNHLVFGSATNLTYGYVTMLPRWRKSVRIIVGTKNATATQYQVGLTTGGSFSQVNYVAFDASTGAGSGKITLVANSGVVATSATAITFSAGDTILISCQRDQDYLTGSVTNLTTKTGYTTASYTYLSSNVTNMPNINKFFVGITSANGMTVDSIGITSTTTANANLAIIGDSKTAGAFANTVQTTFARQLANYYQNTIILAGGHNTTADILSALPELIALKPKQVLIGGIGVNDIIVGVATATWKANYVSIISQLQAAGITVFVLDGIYDTSGSNQVYAYLHTTYPALCINTFIQGQRTPGTLSGDGVHQTQLGHDVDATQIIAANVIKNATNNKITTLPYLQDGATNTFSSNYQTIRDSLKIGTYTQAGSNNPAFIDLGSGFSATAGSGNSLKAKIYSNGSGSNAGWGFDSQGMYGYTYTGNYRLFSGATNLAQFATTGLTLGSFGNFGTNIVWGNQTGVSTATPVNLDLGGTFASTVGNLNAGKLIFFHMAGAISQITQSGTGVEFHTYSGSRFNWFINGVNVAGLSTTSFTPAVPVTTIAGTTTLASINYPSGVVKTSGQVSGDMANVSGVPHWYNGSSDQILAFNPLTTTGDIIYSSSGSTAARLGVGSNGTVLGVVSGLPAYVAATTINSTFAQTPQTATYSILTTDFYVDCPTGTFTATLPTAVGVRGKTYVISAGSGTITVATTSSQTINGSATATVNPGSSITVHSDNANWIKN